VATGGRWRRPVARLSAVAVASLAVALLSPTVAGTAAGGGVRTIGAGTTGPAPAYDCQYDFDIDAYTGADATASAIGWEGNEQGVVTCLGGTFFVQDDINRNFGFGIYDGSPTRWTDAAGYLPAQITSFHRSGAAIAITEFADKVTLAGHGFVAVYCRVSVHNTTDQTLVVDPGASPGLVVLRRAPDRVGPGATVDHDYVVAADRFGQRYPWPRRSALADAGSFDRHYTDMARFWQSQLAQIAAVTVPDRALDDAYRAGFIETQIARSGNDLDTGVNGYASEFSHDVVGILANLFTQGYFADAHALLLEARSVVGSQGQYEDGLWTYDWPWAIYLLKTGDLSFVRQNFATDGPGGADEPSIEAAAHTIAADRTGPGGVMGLTDDIDTDGYWTVDDYEALMGLAAYRYLAERLGNDTEAAWATSQYDALLAATNSTLETTIAEYHLAYLPCSLVEPNSANRCQNPEDANWAAPLQFGKWAWDAPLFGAAVNGPGISLIDATYDYGFGRLEGELPPNTFGGYPSDYYSTAYNAGYGSWGLASADHRDQGILSYEFMIDNDQSGPNSWWESSTAPSATTPWIGRHPAAGQGSSPHAWGMAEANKVLLDSLAAQEAAGALIVGRGVPTSWLAAGRSMTVDNFPTTDGGRLDLTISSTGHAVTLSVHGPLSGPVLFEVPSFVDNIARSSVGTVDEDTGVVTVPRTTTTVTVTLTRPVER